MRTSILLAISLLGCGGSVLETPDAEAVVQDAAPDGAIELVPDADVPVSQCLQRIVAAHCALLDRCDDDAGDGCPDRDHAALSQMRCVCDEIDLTNCLASEIDLPCDVPAGNPGGPCARACLR